MPDKPGHIEHFKRYFGLIAIKKEFIIAKVFVLILCLVVLLSTPGESRAESSIATGNGAAAAHLIFRIHIPVFPIRARTLSRISNNLVTFKSVYMGKNS